MIQSATRFAPLDGQLRPAWAEIDLGAIRHNAEVLAAEVHPARLCAVVKAAGYGHGAPEVARAALEGGAEWLAVALVEEGRELRSAGIEAPVLVLSEPAPAAMPDVVECSLTPTLYSAVGLDAVRSAVRAGGGGSFSVHIKVDTGMHRVGASPGEAVALALDVDASPELDLGGFWTHLAVSDEVADPYTSHQVAPLPTDTGCTGRGRGAAGDVPRRQLGRRPVASAAVGSTWCGAVSPCTGCRPAPTGRPGIPYRCSGPPCL